MPKKTRRRKRRRRRTRRRGGTPPTAADYATICANARAGIIPMPLPTYEEFCLMKRADNERKAFLKSGKPLNEDPEKMHGGRLYPKTRTHIFSRATPTHSLGRSKTRKSRRRSRRRRSTRSRRSRRSRKSKKRSKRRKTN